MFATTFTMLERKISNNLNCLYLLNRPVYQIDHDKRLTPAEHYGDAGNVTAIELDNHDRFHISFASRSEMVLTPKKVVTCSDAAIGPSCQEFLESFGYVLPDAAASGQQRLINLPNILTPAPAPTTIPPAYIIIDCEFGNLFRRTNTPNTINWQVMKAAGLKTNVFQLSAIGFNRHRQTSVFFNRYFDNPDFLPEKKLAGLAATGLTLAQYERQGDPLTVIKAFINQVLQPALPLVFWDQTQDIKYLRRLIAQHYDQLTPSEQHAVTTPVTIFDAQAYTNMIINLGNHKNGYHNLPLNGLAAIFNLTNPNQHNALWDVQTTELVLQKLARLHQQAPTETPRPVPLSTPLPPAPVRTRRQRRNAKYALVKKLHAHGKTYREIAAATGISISSVNYILKKAVNLHPQAGVTPL